MLPRRTDRTPEPPMGKRARVVLDTVEPPGLRFITRFESGAELPLASTSGRDGASPVEAVLAALGGCTGMDVVSILRKKRQVITEYEVVVEGERRGEHPRVYTRIEIVHRLRGRN